MSRDSLLDEAIVKAKETKDWQLVEWLRMARGGESAAKWYTEKLRDANQTVRKLLDENAKLREERDMYRDLVGNMVHPDIPDQLYAENVKLRELVAYMHRCYVIGHDWGFYGAPEKEHVEATMRKLGIGVDE